MNFLLKLSCRSNESDEHGGLELQEQLSQTVRKKIIDSIVLLKEFHLYQTYSFRTERMVGGEYAVS